VVLDAGKISLTFPVSRAGTILMIDTPDNDCLWVRMVCTFYHDVYSKKMEVVHAFSEIRTTSTAVADEVSLGWLDTAMSKSKKKIVD